MAYPNSGGYQGGYMQQSPPTQYPTYQQPQRCPSSYRAMYEKEIGMEKKHDQNRGYNDGPTM